MNHALRRMILTAAVLGAAAWARAASESERRVVDSLPAYRPETAVSGTIRLWGHGSTKTDFMQRLVTRWEAGFARFQPGVTFDYRMYGTASAVGALYAGAGDLAILGEELFPFEARAYEKAMGYPAQGVEIATGSLDVRNFDFAQMVFVHRDNPLSRMTLAQLDAVFGTEHRRGAPKNFRTWGDLGLTGEWADRPIHLYGWSFDNDFWIYLSEAVFGGSHRWNAAMKEYAHVYRPDGTIYDAGLQILEALARDRDGIALSNRRYLNPGVKPLALAAEAGGPYADATKENLIDRTYPLTRVIPAYFNQAPGEPVDPKVKEFLRYILSREGQDDIAQDGEYLPLSSQAAAAAREKLEGTRPGPAAIRIWGGGQMETVIRAWEDGYRRHHPDARFENRLKGTDTAVAGLYAGTADLAFLGREVSPVESMAFAWEFRYKPSAVIVMNGSVDQPGKSHALAIWVHADNPLARMTLAQLDAVFGAEHRRGAPKTFRSWGDLGLTGDWAGQPIHAYGYDVDTGTAAFFRQTVLVGSRKWNWDALREFKNREQPDGSVLTADRQIVDAVAGDRFGIGVANLPDPGMRVKAVALAAGDGEAFLPTRETVIAQTYPLARTVWAAFNRAPGQPADPRVKEFLAYVLSPEGQGDVARDGGYLPLAAAAAAERRALDPTGGK